MAYDYLMYSATILYMIYYIPELYANYKNKNANIYNIPEKIIMLTATTLALSYAIVNNNKPLIANYAPNITLDLIALLMRLYYVFFINKSNKILLVSSEEDQCKRMQVEELC